MRTVSPSSLPPCSSCLRESSQVPGPAVGRQGADIALTKARRSRRGNGLSFCPDNRSAGVRGTGNCPAGQYPENTPISILRVFGHGSKMPSSASKSNREKKIPFRCGAPCRPRLHARPPSPVTGYDRLGHRGRCGQFYRQRGLWSGDQRVCRRPIRSEPAAVRGSTALMFLPANRFPRKGYVGGSGERTSFVSASIRNTRIAGRRWIRRRRTLRKISTSPTSSLLSENDLRGRTPYFPRRTIVSI